MKYNFQTDTLYRKINLYEGGESLNYPMNWVISQKLLDSMRTSLDKNKEVRRLIDKLNANKK
jgi:hypothetical protein